MHVLRGVLALSLVVSLFAYELPVYAVGKPLGILTLAYGAHLGDSRSDSIEQWGGESCETVMEFHASWGTLFGRVAFPVVRGAQMSRAAVRAETAPASEGGRYRGIFWF